MANFDANTYPTSGILTSKIWSIYDVESPAVGNELMRRFGFQYAPSFQTIKALGREVGISNTNWSAWEDNWFHRPVKVKSNVSDPGAGNQIQFTIDSSFLDSENNFYIRKGEIITIPGTLVQAHVYDIDTSTPSAPVVTLKPSKTTHNIGALTAGQLLAITSAAYANGTGQPEGATVGVSKRNFKMQIIKETVGAQGQELAKQPWYKVYEGGNLVGWFTPGTAAAEYRFALKTDGAFWVGQETDNTGLAVPSGEEGAGNMPYTTKGFLPTAMEHGSTDPYTVGSWDVLDLDDYGLYFKSQGLTTGYAWFSMGSLLQNEVENTLVDFLADKSNTDLARFESAMMGNNKGYAVSVGFKSIMKGGITYVLANNGSFDNSQTFAADTNYNMQSWGAILPITTFQDPKNPGQIVNNFETRYLSGNGYSRKMEVWDVRGAGGGQYVTDIDKMNHYLRGQFGFQFMKMNQAIVIKPA